MEGGGVRRTGVYFSATLLSSHVGSSDSLHSSSAEESGEVSTCCASRAETACLSFTFKTQFGSSVIFVN